MESEGIGVTKRELEPGTVVMVPVGQISAAVNGYPCIIAWAVVIGPAEVDKNGAARWWFDVYMLPGTAPLPQMYRAEEILGIPAPGLRMEGAPGQAGRLT